MADTLEPGTQLGGRFAIVGVLGVGGTATVYLAVDSLRGEQVALKVVHGNLSGDASVRFRLQREVQAATLLKHPAALVAWDLHELDGRIALSMPYHPGQTLTEAVRSHGPLSIDTVRQMAITLTGALMAAHRKGLLHRDVTANNVLVADGQAVLTDFGLSRPADAHTRSTTTLGTAGFAAPEVLQGQRATSAADWYGLGCALYLSVAGDTPFGSGNPMVVLTRQLEGSIPSIRSVRPDCPEDLAETIMSLLRRDPDARPDGPELLQALQGHRAPSTGASVPAGPTAHLPPGRFGVIVIEAEEDRSRRHQLRVTALQEADTVSSQLARHARGFWTGVMTTIGIQPANRPSPEQRLTRAVAIEAEVPERSLQTPEALLRARFLLVDRVERSSAERLTEAASKAGFQSWVVEHKDQRFNWMEWGPQLIAIMWVAFALMHATPLRMMSTPALFACIGISILYGRLRTREPTDLHKLPVAYGSDLSPWLTHAIPGRFEPAGTPAVQTTAPAPAASTRGEQLNQRAQDRIADLQSTVERLDLPPAYAADVRTTVKTLSATANELAAQLDTLDIELQTSPEDTGWIETRIARLQTQERAGQVVDANELTKLRQALDAAQQAQAATSRLERQHTATLAGLVEIAATASSVRRDLLASGGHDTALTDALNTLRAEAAEVRRAQKELA